MATVAEPKTSPMTVPGEQTRSQDQLEPGYLVICWDDPVNLMEYVTHVFQRVFAWKKEKAEKHMMEVHNNGKSVLVRDGKERAEHYVHELQKYRLHATMEHD